MSDSKHLARDIGGLMFLARAQLDQDGQAHLKRLKDSLSKQPPSLLVRAFVEWDASGRPQRDPRPPVVRVMGGESPSHYASKGDLERLRKLRSSSLVR